MDTGKRDIELEEGTEDTEEMRILPSRLRCVSALEHKFFFHHPYKQNIKIVLVTKIFLLVRKHFFTYRYRIEDKERTTVTDDVEEVELIPEILQTEEEIAQCMIKWKPYLAYVDDLMSKALIQAVSTRY